MQSQALPVLHLERVGYEYTNGSHSFRALADVSFTIHKGEYVAIVGASGSGKTTLMNLMGLMATATEGRLELMGKPVNGLDESALAALRNQHLGFVFQEYHLLPRLSVLDNVLLPATYAPENEQPRFHERALPLLDKLGLATQARKRPDALSGGQKQRVAISRALVNNPDLILADEPTGALDSKTSHDLLDLLDELHGEGATIVLVTHDPQVAARALRTITISDGRIASDTGVKLRDSAPSRAPEPGAPNASWIQMAASAVRSAREAVRGAFRTFLSAKMRTALTLLGLVVGVFCVATIIGASGELQHALQKNLKNLGITATLVMADENPEASPAIGQWRGFPAEQGRQALEKLLGHRFDVDFIFLSEAEIAGQENPTLQGTAATSPISEAQSERLNVEILSGHPLDARDFSPSEAEAREGVFLSDKRCQRLFRPELCLRKGGAALVGERVRIRQSGADVLTPILGFFKISNDSHFAVKQSETGSLVYSPRLAKRLRQHENAILLSISPNRTAIDPGITSFVQNFFDSQHSGSIRFRVMNFSEMINQVEKVLFGIAAFLSLVAALSILVGGINIMNIMLVTVVERTKEIGLRKAVGAPPRSIRRQFLAEAVILSLAGGTVGIVVALAAMNGLLYAIAGYTHGFLEYHFLVDKLALTVGFSTSLATGLVFGIIPAFKASKLDVVDAIRKEG